MYYITPEGYPVNTNSPLPEWIEKSKEEYDVIVANKQASDRARRATEIELLKPAQEYEAKIQAKLREIAIKELEITK